MAEPYTDDELCEVRKRAGRLDLSQRSRVDFNPRDREVIRGRVERFFSTLLLAFRGSHEEQGPG